jgi:hypothetical protein
LISSGDGSRSRTNPAVGFVSHLRSDSCAEQRGHHFAAVVDRHAHALPRHCRSVEARLATDHLPLRFMRRQDRASHRSGLGRLATLLFPNTHRLSRSPSWCASYVAQSLGLEAHTLMARSACNPAKAASGSCFAISPDVASPYVSDVSLFRSKLNSDS